MNDWVWLIILRWWICTSNNSYSLNSRFVDSCATCSFSRSDRKISIDVLRAQNWFCKVEMQNTNLANVKYIYASFWNPKQIFLKHINSHVCITCGEFFLRGSWGIFFRVTLKTFISIRMTLGIIQNDYFDHVRHAWDIFGTIRSLKMIFWDYIFENFRLEMNKNTFFWHIMTLQRQLLPF